MGKAHVMAIPYPAQGHVLPLMELAQCLACNGIRVTFVNTESNHHRVVKALPENLHELITLVSVSDGFQSWEDRMDFAKSVEALSEVVPGEVEALIGSINAAESDDAVTCIITDAYMAGITQVNEKYSGLKRAAFLTAPVALLALTGSADKLVDDGVIDTDGTPLRSEVIRLSPSLPEMSPNYFAWACLPDLAARKAVFRGVVENNKSAKLAQWLVCNSSYELEGGALAFLDNCLPIGPLLASSRLGKPAGCFWPENTTCLSWLDQQQPNSVVYVAFGSFTVFDSVQFQELALGLELTHRPFLWVVRQDNVTSESDHHHHHDNIPVGFKERVEDLGKMVDWAPQQQVLSHPSVACFVSHCGWNSTLESVSNGVPILCWPYFADQFLNQSYIVDHWGVGLSLDKDDQTGIIGREEIKNKVELVLTDPIYKNKAVELQEKTMATARSGGSSHMNLTNFIHWIKQT
ncbi:hypothetical protein C2S52_002436 [Perilla frutescens var. hirtella]|nr:hypothetical protein C2S52_002436 [Perilla frutescens var. hirtella]